MTGGSEASVVEAAPAVVAAHKRQVPCLHPISIPRAAVPRRVQGHVQGHARVEAREPHELGPRFSRGGERATGADVGLSRTDHV